MAKVYDPNIKTIDEIYLKKISVFQDPQIIDVTIHGYYYNSIEEMLVYVSYWCEFSILMDILLAAKECGEPIIADLTKSLNANKPEFLICLDIEKMFGRPLKIENVLMKIYLPMEQDKNGDWNEAKDKNFFVIDSFEGKK
jgi:hypothetical protein